MIDLTDAETDALALVAKEELAWQRYEDYFLLANPGMKMYPHVKLICDKLQKIADGEQIGRASCRERV